MAALWCAATVSTRPHHEKKYQIFCVNPLHQFRAFVFLCALFLLASAPFSTADATVYRWVDDLGKTHYSEIVPQQYKGVAKQIDTSANSPTAKQRRDAQARAQKPKSVATDIYQQPLPASEPPAMAAFKPVSKRPDQTPTEQTDCETWGRLYEESMACFGPFKTVRGIKSEAFEVRNVVTEPPQARCRRSIP